MKKILLTGFKPFLGDKTNASELIVKQISNVITEILPVEFENAFLKLQTTVEKHRPDYIIMLGLSASSTRIKLEKVAMNWNESEHADEAGFIAPRDKIHPDQPLSLMTSFPINEVYNHLNAENYPVDISFSAGSFVCNNIFFKTLNAFPSVKSVFIHVPPESVIRVDWQVEVIRKIINELNAG